MEHDAANKKFKYRKCPLGPLTDDSSNDADCDLSTTPTEKTIKVKVSANNGVGKITTAEFSFKFTDPCPT